MKKIKKNKVRSIHFRLTEEQNKRIEKFCKKEKMSVSKFMNNAAEYYLLDYYRGEADD